MQATAVGGAAYARQLATEARRFTVTHSELVEGINRILIYVTWVLVVIGPLLFFRQLQDQSVSAAITGAVAGVVLMVPEGLVLLTSISFGLAAVVLARRRVLVQELPAVEGLARVDVVCLDKTGTLTEGIVEFDRIEILGGADADVVAAALGALNHDEGGNATQDAISGAFPAPSGWVRDGYVPFSSGRKWSGASYGDHGTWVLGAPEMVWLDASDPVRRQADEIAATGNRVLLLARADALAGEQLPPNLRAEALVLLEEKVRPDAAETLRYFHEQGVTLKVISGDNPRTVGAVARRVGLPDAGEPFDARELPEDIDELAEVLEHHSVFGRVTPHQKRAMVKALQSREHVVAMTGDGVNDALALKDADIGVAMGSGAAATRAVAQLVLLDSEFATLPGVVAEGRRVIANIERVSNLFLTKTTYAALLAIVTVIVGWPYLFLPRQSTIVNALTIGIPAFFLALAPNTRRYVPGFVRRVMRFAIPAGLIVGTTVVIAYALAREETVGTREARTMTTVVLMVLGLYVLVMLARPFTRYRAILVLTMIGLFIGALAIPAVRDFYALVTAAAGCRRQRSRHRGRRLCCARAGRTRGDAVDCGTRSRYSQPFFLNWIHRISGCARHRRERDEVSEVPAQLGHELEVHPVDAGDQRRHEQDRAVARRLLHHVVHPVRDHREVRLEQTGEQVPLRLDEIGDPERVVVDVLHQDDRVRSDPVDLPAQEGGDDLAQRRRGPAESDQTAAESEDLLRDRVMALVAEHDLLDVVESFVDEVGDAEVRVDDHVEQRPQRTAEVVVVAVESNPFEASLDLSEVHRPDTIEWIDEPRGASPRRTPRRLL